jgi:hypothetical protein
MISERVETVLHCTKQAEEMQGMGAPGPLPKYEAVRVKPFRVRARLVFTSITPYSCVWTKYRPGFKAMTDWERAATLPP